MEFLLLLLPVALIGLFSLGGDDDDANQPRDDDATVRTGSDDDEVIDGGTGDDLVFGAGAPDIINGRLGNDILFGEGGDDNMNGGQGDDIMLGANGNDEMTGGAGRDLMFGGADRDEMRGSGGDDILIGGSDVDTLYGGAGNDVLAGVEITADDFDEPDLIEVSNQIKTLVGLRFGADVADRFDARIERSVLSANEEVSPFPEGVSPPLPDRLFGGEGSDTLFGDHGDVLTGGGTDAADLFVVVQRTDAEPVTIADFDVADSIEIDTDGLPQGAIGFTLQDGGAVITVGDTAVAVVNGVTDVSVLQGRVTLTPAA
jgi:Ca2+-binding RTX toxin-like protein